MYINPLRILLEPAIDVGMLPEKLMREFRCPKCGLVYNRDLNGANERAGMKEL